MYDGRTEKDFACKFYTVDSTFLWQLVTVRHSDVSDNLWRQYQQQNSTNCRNSSHNNNNNNNNNSSSGSRKKRRMTRMSGSMNYI